jgi:predicted transcriptional regulator of viral defense system
MATALQQARGVFLAQGGILRTHEALAARIHPRTLYALRARGEIELLTRGVYRLANLPPLAQPDLVTVAKRIPQGVICLISALAWHELTTQIPHVVHVAIPRSLRQPCIEFPPVQVYRFSGAALTTGIETHRLDQVPIRVYSPEKTLADCCKFRHKLGMEVFLEALKTYCRRRQPRLQLLLQQARTCRVEHVLRPYLEALV